jgi:hypothetical protein
MLPTNDPETLTEMASFLRERSKTLVVTFFEEAVLDEKASWGWEDQRFDPVSGIPQKLQHAGAGRPIYAQQDWVEIRVPGDKDEIRRRAVRASDQQRWPEEWRAYQEKRATPLVGTPLDKLPFLTKSQVLEFQATGIRTAENLRDMPDSVSQKFMGINAVRARVKAFLDAAEGVAISDKYQAELQTRDEQIAALQKQMQELLASQKAKK